MNRLLLYDFEQITQISVYIIRPFTTLLAKPSMKNINWYYIYPNILI